MKVYLAGERNMFDTTGKQTAWAQGIDYHDRLCANIRRRLFSFYYHGFTQDGVRTMSGVAIHDRGTTQDVLLSKQEGMDLFLDSGAFTAFTKKKKIDVEQYAAYIHSSAKWIIRGSFLESLPVETYQN